jgi:hypothetical protein
VSIPFSENPLDLYRALRIGNDMHDMRVTLNNHLLGQLNGPRFSDTSDIITPKVDQHQVLSDLLGIIQRWRLLMSWSR